MKISKHIHQLNIKFHIPISPEQKIERTVNMFLIVGKKIHLIDCGVSSALPIIKDYIESLGYNFPEVKNLLLTHSHPDHIGCAKSLVKDTGCKVYAHSAEQGMIENTEHQFEIRPIPGFHQLVEEGVKIDQLINNGDEIMLEEDLSLQILHTPGHSSGSVTYYLKEEKACFTGDAVLLPWEIPIFENTADYFQSIDTIRNLGAELLFSAWDDPKRNKQIPEILDTSSNYIRTISTVVQKVAQNDYTRGMDFCLKVLEELKLPTQIANPLLLKSFLACLNN